MSVKEFFIDEEVTIPFQLFGKTHLFLIILIIISCLVIYHYRLKIIKLKPKTKRKITQMIALVLLLNMLILYISSFYYKNFNYKTMLPFHPCYIANYFYIFITFLKKDSLYTYAYFLSFIGPIPAIIFFDVPSTWEAFNFYLYIISHHFLLITTFLTFYMYPKKIKRINILKLVITLNIIYVFMNIFNYYFHTNYFFSNSIPLFILELIPFLKYLPTTIILEVTGIIIVYILYQFFNKQYHHLCSLLENRSML